MINETFARLNLQSISISERKLIVLLDILVIALERKQKQKRFTIIENKNQKSIEKKRCEHQI